MSSSSSSSCCFLITGASAGVGYATADALAAAGHHVIVTARTQAKADDTSRRIAAAHPNASLQLTALPLDLLSFPSIHALVAVVSEQRLPLHCLICNAGANAAGGSGVAHGLRLLWVNNYLGHYHLTRLLLPRLQLTARQSGLASRVVQVSSFMHRCTSPQRVLREAVSTQPDRLMFAYSNSKLAQLIFSFELQRRYAQHPDGRVLSIAVNPGAVNSSIWRHLQQPAACIANAIFRLMFLTTQQAATALVRAATGPAPAPSDLLYLSAYGASEWSWLNVALDAWLPGSLMLVSPSRANAAAYDPAFGTQLWEQSERQLASILNKPQTELYEG